MSEDKQENLPKQAALSNPKEWVEKHGDALFAYAFRYFADSSTAEDLVQETLLAALKGQAGFAGASMERTWLIGILKNKVMDHFRKLERETQLDQPEWLSDENEADYIVSGPDKGSWNPPQRPLAWSIDSNDPVEKEQFWAQLQNCLEDLDQRLAIVYNLRDIQEIKYEEVCNVLSITPTNLRVMLHRARKSIRRCLESRWVDA